MNIDRAHIENVLYQEARFMDEHRYDDWLQMWTDDAMYWVPCNRDDIDPTKSVSIILDDYQGLKLRIERLKSGAAYGQEPPSKMRRVVSNVELDRGENGEISVFSNFNLTELRRGRQATFAGRTTHKFRKFDGGLKIAYKKVALVNNDEPIDNLTFLI